MLIRIKTLASLALLLSLAPIFARADAIVVSQAMFADTIAEYFIGEEGITVELEIGGNDIPAFSNLLPDEIHQEMGFGDEPFPERLGRFFAEDLAILVDREPLRGGILEMGPETRVQRDPVTGEELPAGEDEPEIVLRAKLFYRFDERPESLVMMAPSRTAMASVGFVVYHQGVAVNDFRYLSQGYELLLDWDDPWYSRFSSRALARQYSAPMTGFIYVEPYEVRKEIIVRPRDIQNYVDIGLDDAETITPEMQESVKAGIVAFLADHFPVTIDGEAVEGEVDRVNFLQRSLKASVVVDGQDIPLLPATVGVITVFPTEGLPDQVTMEWTLFNEDMQRVPVSAVDEAGGLPSFLEPDYSLLTWQNFLKNPTLPTLTKVGTPPTSLQRASNWARWLFALLVIAGIIQLFRSGSGKLGGALFLVVGLAGAAWSVITWQSAQLDSKRTTELVGDLLHNIYRAFDYRGEETVYDVLAQSVSGDLLADVYLETRQGLELANQGGAQVKVKDIEMISTNLVSSSGNQLEIEARWNVAGSVGHWGHIHQRTNGYHAMLKLEEQEGAWKLTGLDILEEERL